MMCLSCFSAVELVCEKADTEVASLPRKCEAPRCLKVGEGQSCHSINIKQHCHQKYFEVVDLVITGIEERFNQLGYVMYTLRISSFKSSKAKDY